MASDNNVAFRGSELKPKNRRIEMNGEFFEFGDITPEQWDEMISFEPKNGESAWNAQDRQIMVFLSEEDGKRWLELRKRKENPVTVQQTNALLLFLWETVTGVPIPPASPSQPGAGRTAGSSKAA